MRRIQSKNQRIGSYEISKISLPCFDDKISVLQHLVIRVDCNMLNMRQKLF